jgi:IclR family mhp operon transcriptional activator
MESKSAGNVRAIGRALKVLQVINLHRSLSMMEIAKLADLPYPTTFRIVETLIEEGMIEQEPTRKHYRPTSMVQTLSAGYRPEDRIVSVARPHIVSLTRRVAWPIVVCQRFGLSMMIRDSTHLMTPLTMTIYHPGYIFPILDSSSGRAYLAFCPPGEYAAIMDELERRNHNTTLQSQAGIEPLLETIRAQGYSTHDRTLSTAEPGKNSSLSAPVFQGADLVGTITLVFFASAMPLNRASGQFAEPLMQTARAISADLTDGAATSGPNYSRDE